MTEKTRIVLEAVRRFKNLPTRTIARYILENHGDLWDGSLEKIRSAVRTRRGTNGEEIRRGVPLLIPGEHIKLPQTWKKDREPHHLSPGLWLFLPDIHVPFHDITAVESAVSYGKSQKVDGIVFPGDAQDCASISFWVSQRKRNFDREVEIFVDFLDFIQCEFPEQKKVYLPGNHEYRLPRMYQTKVPDLMGLPLLAMDAVLNLEGRGYEFLEYSQLIVAGELPILHGHELGGVSTTVNPARGLMLKTKSFSMCAHFHRTSEHSDRSIRNKLLTTWSMGCLCDLSPDYYPYGNNWNWGFALVNVEKDGNFEVENKRILPNGKVV
jgi:hypothetical protein